MKPEFSRQTFEKYPNIKFHENPSSGSRFVPGGRKDGQTATTKLISRFFAVLRTGLKQPTNESYKTPRSSVSVSALVTFHIRYSKSCYIDIKYCRELRSTRTSNSMLLRAVSRKPVAMEKEYRGRYSAQATNWTF